jgi:hypothetical protein
MLDDSSKFLNEFGAGLRGAPEMFISGVILTIFWSLRAGTAVDELR